MPPAVIVLMALAAGALLAAQGPIFARSASYAGGSLQAATLAFAVALAALLLLSLFGSGLPKASGLVRMPAWLWSGGLIGLTMVLLTLYAVPRIGVASFVAAVVCGQLLAAMAYDHTGAFGLALRPIGLKDLAGALLLLAGLALLVKR